MGVVFDMCYWLWGVWVEGVYVVVVYFDDVGCMLFVFVIVNVMFELIYMSVENCLKFVMSLDGCVVYVLWLMLFDVLYIGMVCFLCLFDGGVMWSVFVIVYCDW